MGKSSKLVNSTIFGIIILFIFGCTPAKYVASSNQNEGIQKVYRQGIELLISKKQNSGMAAGIKRYEKGKEHMQLILIIQNNGNKSFNVLPTSINVFHEEEGKTEKLEIYPPDEAVAKITFDERFAAAINAAAAAYNQNTIYDTEINEDLAQSNALQAAVKGKNVRKTLLRNETLFEGDRIFGVVYFALKDSGKLKITIPLGDDTHTFYFNSVDN